MNGWDQFWMLMGISIGVGIGSTVCVGLMGLFGFIADMRCSWQTGRELAQLVTEKEHKRRVELLAKMIELERAMQPVPSEKPVIESQERVVNELMACQREPWPSGDDQNCGVGK